MADMKKILSFMLTGSMDLKKYPPGRTVEENPPESRARELVNRILTNSRIPSAKDLYKEIVETLQYLKK